jgi:cell division protein FtsW
MMNEARSDQLEHADGPGSGRNEIILIAAALMAIGLVMVGSATSSLDSTLFASRFWTTAFGRQACFAIVGLGICVAVAWVSRGVLASEYASRGIARWFYGLAIVLLLLVLVPGLSDASHGSQRWLRFSLGGVAVGLQPSEVAKLALIGFLAYRLGDAKSDPSSFFRGFIPAAGAILLCCGLVGKENFGTAALLIGVAFVMLLAGGCRFHHLCLMVAAAAVGLVYLIRVEPYRLARLTAYQDIWSDPQGAGYQPLQSLTTIASGGWWGVGLGSGLQKYGYLPESHTDFIFAVLCEELGLLGAGLVLALFCAFIWVGMRISLRAATRFEQLLGFGLTFLVGLQAAMNIAVVTVIAPTTGVPLPFVSAGGSGLFATCGAVGVLSAIAARGSGKVSTVSVEHDTAWLPPQAQIELA